MMTWVDWFIRVKTLLSLLTCFNVQSLKSLKLFVLEVVFERFVHIRPINEAAESSTIAEAVDLLNTDPRVRLKLGARSHNDGTVPRHSFGYWFYIRADTTNSPTHFGTSVNLTITQYNLWFAAPLIKMPQQKKKFSKDADGVIKVLVPDGNNDDDEYTIKRTLVVSPKNKIIPEMLKMCTMVATTIADRYLAGEDTPIGKPSRVYILHGLPGCGKSTTVRILAQKLNAYLFSEYDPRNKRSLLKLVDMHADEETPLVVAYEECDISFEQIARAKVPSHSSSNSNTNVTCVKDKVSWNKLFDNLASDCFNTIIIMTTNSTVEELWTMAALADSTCSMLRDGRIDGHFVWKTDTEPLFVPPIPMAATSTSSRPTTPDTPALTSSSIFTKEKKRCKTPAWKL